MQVNQNCRNNALNVCRNVQQQIIQENLLPPHFHLEENNGPSIAITFTQPNCNATGDILLGEPKFFLRDENAEGFIHMECHIRNKKTVKITVENFEELLEMLQFCQSLLPFQPEVDYLRYSVIPLHLLNHRGIPNEVRNFNKIILGNQ